MDVVNWFNVVFCDTAGEGSDELVIPDVVSPIAMPIRNFVVNMEFVTGFNKVGFSMVELR